MNPSTAGRSRRDARRRLNDEVLRLPAVGNSDAHVLEGIGTAWTWFPARARPTTGRRSRKPRRDPKARTGRTSITSMSIGGSSEPSFAT